jgi:hypothetical protein
MENERPKAPLRRWFPSLDVRTPLIGVRFPALAASKTQRVQIFIDFAPCILSSTMLHYTIQHFTNFIARKGERFTMPKWQEYACMVGEGEVVTRAEAARFFGVHKTTAANHLDRAVEHGLLNRAVADGRGGRVKVYALPGTMPQLPGFRMTTIDGDEVRL